MHEILYMQIFLPLRVHVEIQITKFQSNFVVKRANLKGHEKKKD